MMPLVQIIPILRRQLIEDATGNLLGQWATLSLQIWQEWPWSEDNPGWTIERLAGGIPNDLHRSRARAFLALVDPEEGASIVVGFILGYQVFQRAPNLRELSLQEISGSNELDFLFEGGSMFYIDQLGVHPDYRRQHSAEALCYSLMAAAEEQGLRRFVLRTRVDAEAAQALWRKLGFRKLDEIRGTKIRGTKFPEREFFLREV